MGAEGGALRIFTGVTSHATAIAAPDRPDLTYHQLADLVVGTGCALSAAGFQRTDRIALILPNGPEAATAFLSIAGTCVCAPLNPAYREAEFDFYLRDLRPKAIAVAEEGPATRVASTLGIDIIRIVGTPTDPAGTFRLEGLTAASPGDFVPPGPAGPNDTALLLHTSGTTSRPKLVPLTWGNLGQSAANVAQTLGLSSADRCLNVMPLFHIHGLAAAVLASLWSGASVVCTPGFLATSFFDWLDAFDPTWYTGVPAMHQSVLARAPLHSDTLARTRLRFIRSSSAALPTRVLEELESTFGVPVVEAYGMTEAAHQMASNPIPPGVRKTGSVGRPAGSKICVLDDAWQPLPAGVPGRVCISGVNVTSGYVDNPAANRESFAGGWFYTGDLGWMDEDGYLYLSGRSKEIINRAGEKISPGEVDEVLMRHFSVQQCLTFALPDSGLGEEVGAAVVLKPGAAPDEAAIQSFAAQLLADFKVPRRIYFIDELPKGPTGKLQRIGLAARLGITEDSWKRDSQPALAGQADPSVVARVGEIMAAVLLIGSAGPDTNFFDSGGGSLLGASFLARLSNEFHRSLTLIDLFQSPTPSAIAGRLDSGPAAPDQIADGEIEVALSFGQINLWFLDAYEGTGLAWLRPYLIEIRGEIAPGQVRAALSRIVLRHEPLRTVIHNEKGNPRPYLLAAGPVPLEFRDWRGTAADDAAVLEACRQEAARPFRLDSDLLLRAGLHRLEDRRWWLLVVIHHVASDGWSSQILLRELGHLLRGEALEPDPLPVTYSGYARRQRRLLSGERLESLAGYWRRQLEGAPGILDLPLDFPRPGLQTFHGKAVSATLSPDLTARLNELARHRGATLFMTLLAGWKSLLARLCGSVDICVGVPMAGRTRLEWEPLIGLFMNTLPLRSKLDGDPEFCEILERVRETCLQASIHQDLPFEKLVETLQPRRSAAHTPWFQVIFQLRNFPKSVPEAGGVALRQLEFDHDRVVTDLNFEITETAQGLVCRLFYNTALFTEQSAARMLQRFEALFLGAVEAPETRLSQLPLLTAGERSQLLTDWNATEVSYPRDLCVHQLFERQAERTPDAIAVVFGHRRLTYRELNQRSNRLAHHLRNLGVNTEDPVAICVERSLEMVVGLLGILKAGGAWVPLDPAYPRERLDFILEDTQARIVLVQQRLRESLTERPIRAVCLDTEWEEIARSAAANPVTAVRPGHSAYVIYTSGSTGRPKGVPISHRAFVNFQLSMLQSPGLTAVDALLAVTTISFDIAGLELFLPLITGARVVVADQDAVVDGKRLAADIREHAITVMQATPATWRLLLESGWAGSTKLKALCGGEALSRELANQLLSRVESLWNLYGPTETTVWSTLHRVEPGTEPVPVGRPIANTQIYILDSWLQPVPVGVAGELCIGGDGLARGYLNRPELTAEKFVTHPFSAEPDARIYRTGDLARYRPDGNVELLGRMDHQVKIRGFRIELEEIEAILIQREDVSQCVVAAPADSAGEKRLTAYVVPADPRAAPAIASLRDFLKQRLPDYMVPAAFVVVRNLPLTLNGKIDRNALPAPDWTLAGHGEEFSAPNTLLELQLTQIWQRILGVPRVGTGDNFFDLGGHSLLAARLIREIETSLHYSIALPLFFKNPTIAGMTRDLRRERKVDVEPELIPLMPGESPGSLFFLGAGIGTCRLAQVLKGGPASFGTVVSLTSTAARAAIAGKMGELPTLEDLAASHAALVRSRQPSGPCLLAGHSFQGLLAFEVAHQLRREGRQVEMVLLLDAWAVTPSRWRKFRLNLSLMTLASARKSVTLRASQLRALVIGSRSKSAPNQSGPKREDDNPLSGKIPWPVVLKVYNNARKNYTRRPLDCRAILFRSRDNPFARFREVDNDMGWRGLFAGGLETVEVPGDHLSLLKDAHLQTLARLFQERLVHSDAEQPDAEHSEADRLTV
jgi:amino acid adenylation domain-containing protein